MRGDVPVQAVRQEKEGESLLSLLLVLLRSRDWINAHSWGGQSTPLRVPIQKLISSGNNLTDTLRYVYLGYPMAGQRDT